MICGQYLLNFERKIYMTWIPESHIDLITDETKAFGILATLMKDGSPQVTPVWFNTDGIHILINSATGRVKDLNMRRNPIVTLLILDPNDPYRYIQIRGKVVEITTLGARKHIDTLSKKYTGRDIFTSGVNGEVRVTYKILPENVNV
jgi:PPOX class probable F420-dependent enzyme